MSAFLTLENISKYYTSGQSVVMGLHGISLEFARGEFVAITGESGSGKSTLAKVIAGILPYEGGEMSVNGKPTSHYGLPDWEQYRISRISFISQNYDILPGCTVIENVVSALILTGMDKARAAARAEEILAEVELLDKKKRRAAKLSSGQKQRLSIARALAKPAPILIADEPTGNLDRENSAKVIQLLAAAARERLVLMVTHDFNEAQEFATRRIIIRDGEVDADIRLRQIEERKVRTAEETVDDGDNTEKSRITQKDIDNFICDKEKTSLKADLGKKAKNLSRYTAFLQISSRPIWSAIMLFFFALTALALFVFAGTFVINIDDSFTRAYDPSAFANGEKTRIAVVKEDGTSMTKEDYDALLALPFVERIERYGFVSDINFYYRDGVDYNRHFEAVVNDFGSPTGEIKETLTLGDTNIFLQTVPYLPEDKFLTAGRLPENMYEIVAVGKEEMIGTEITFYICNKKSWPVGTYIEVKATVVGVTDLGRHFYVAEQLGRVLTGGRMGEAIFAPIYDIPDNLYVTGDDPMGGRFICSVAMESSLLDQLYSKVINKGWGDLNVEEEYYKTQYPFFDIDENPFMLKPYGTHTSTYRYYYLVKPGLFEQMVPDTGSGVISLTISDYAYTDRVLKAVHELGYPALSPYQIGLTKQNERLAAERLQTLKICILALASIFFLQIFVLRAMFSMETGEFKLLANLGLRCHTAKHSVLWQVIVFTLAGQFLAFVAIFFAARAGISRIVQIVKYLPLSYILIFMAIHLMAGFLAALWIQRFIGLQVYPSSLDYTDLDLDREEEEE